MSKFKMGDKVMVNKSNQDHNVFVGVEYTVDQNNNFCPWLITEMESSGTKVRCTNEDNLKLVEEESEHRFEIGDKIRMNHNCSGNMEGEIFILEYRDKSLFAGMCYCSQYWELIEKRGTFESSEKNNNNDSVEVSKDNTYSMDLLKKFADALLGEPERSLQKYEITDSRGNLTCQGAGLYLNWKFKQDLPEFQKDVLAVLIKADKKGKKDEE